ncbi:MAG: 16S rRNA processing protein RimM [Candidatus Tectomicrobia bacterium]|nr:16S rRNA processing protein RimM [Candidatus Tectomicrobia bacterium]
MTDEADHGRRGEATTWQPDRQATAGAAPASQDEKSERRRDVLPTGEPAAAEPPEGVVIGRVTRPHGRRGAVRLAPALEVELLARLRLREVLLRRAAAGGAPFARTFRVESLTPHRRLVVLQLGGCRSIGDAEQLVGAEVVAPRAAVQPLLQDAYLWPDLVGAQVETKEGPLGLLRDFFSTASHDVWVVETPAGELLLPATDEVIEAVDLAARRILVQPLEGLLEACTHERHAH